MTTAEWEDAKQRALDELGMTYHQLAEEARNNNFSSSRARRLWMFIGEQDA